ncbi:hypothetical protein ACI65C_011412 [Semiaphis heraclei]
MSLKKCKGRSVTNAKKEALVEFMENNTDLKRGDVPIYGQPNTLEPNVSFEGYEIIVDSSTNSLYPLVESLFDYEKSETETCLPDLSLPRSIELVSTDIIPLQDFIMTDNTSKDNSKREDKVGLKTKNG